MDTFRKSARLAAISAAVLFALNSNQAAAQGGYYNDNRYNNNSGYNNNNGYDDYDDYDGSYQDFYDDLSPYGEWISDRDYGYIWIPDVNANFRPYYTNGYWAMTEYGNTWVSNYPWGWATFHYGRWTFDDYYGWVWIPGSEWGPAWVNWRNSGNGYYGWAPMGPGSTIDYYDDGYYAPSSWWTFAPQQYLYSANLYNYTRAPRYNRDYLRRSQVIRESQRANGYSFFSGPGRSDIERAIGRPVKLFSISNRDRAGVTRVSGSSIDIFRPRITRSSNASNLRPQRVQQGSINIEQTFPTAGSGRPQSGGNNGSRPDNNNGRPQNGGNNGGSNSNGGRIQQAGNGAITTQTGVLRPTRFERANNGMEMTTTERARLVSPSRTQQERQSNNRTEVTPGNDRMTREQQRGQQEQQRTLENQRRSQEQQQQAQQQQEQQRALEDQRRGQEQQRALQQQAQQQEQQRQLDNQRRNQEQQRALQQQAQQQEQQRQLDNQRRNQEQQRAQQQQEQQRQIENQRRSQEQQQQEQQRQLDNQRAQQQEQQRQIENQRQQQEQQRQLENQRRSQEPEQRTLQLQQRERQEETPRSTERRIR